MLWCQYTAWSCPLIRGALLVGGASRNVFLIVKQLSLLADRSRISPLRADFPSDPEADYVNIEDNVFLTLQYTRYGVSQYYDALILSIGRC